MMLTCLLIVTIDAGIPVREKFPVQGKLLKQSQTKYLVDFSGGLTNFKLTGTPSDYKRVLIEKSECVPDSL